MMTAIGSVPDAGGKSKDEQKKAKNDVCRGDDISFVHRSSAVHSGSAKTSR